MTRKDIKKLITRLKSKVVFITIFFFSTNLLGQTPNFNFDKNKWCSVSSYRYDMIKSSDFYDFLKGKTKRQIKKLLGAPNYKEKNTYLYCLDICNTTFDKKNHPCISSSISLLFKEDVVFDFIIMNVGG